MNVNFHYYFLAHTNNNIFLHTASGNMDNVSSSQKSVSGKSKSQNTRRTWSPQEEFQLIVGLKDVVSAGWKSENGFKTGYLAVLEKHMSNVFPGTTIKADPHIHSKIHVWKKQYASLSTMLTRSGFGWNDSVNMLDVSSDQVWNDYIKVRILVFSIMKNTFLKFNQICSRYA